MKKPPKTPLTGWYRGDQKPVRVGWYQTKLRGDRYHDRRHWNGKIWSVMGHQDLPSATQNWMWRGRESA